MNGEMGDNKEPDNVEDTTSEVPYEDTVVLDTSESVDNVGDISVEINVEELVEKIKAESADDVDEARRVKRRLEEAQEKIGDKLDSTYNINLDED